MMKKILLLAALAVVLVACDGNDKFKPEYVTAPVVTDVKYTSGEISEHEAVNVSAKVTSKYGINSIFIYYWTGDDVSKGRESSIMLYDKKYETSYSGMIPGHKTGAKVSFQVASYSPFDVLGVSEIYTYEVKDGSGGGEVPID